MRTFILRTDPIAGIAVWVQSAQGNRCGVLADHLEITTQLRDRIESWIAWCQLLTESQSVDAREWERYDNEG